MQFSVSYEFFHAVAVSSNPYFGVCLIYVVLLPMLSPEKYVDKPRLGFYNLNLNMD